MNGVHRHRSQKYGLTRDQTEALLSRQGGVCPICQTSKRLVVDHDHTHNKIRGFLCNDCNLGIGRLREDPKLLDAAKRYLQRKLKELPHLLPLKPMKKAGK